MKQMIKYVTCYQLLLICIWIFFLGSCQKDPSNDPIKNNDSAKAINTAKSNIVYNDLIPDSTVFCSLPVSGLGSCSSIFYLDLNKDGINDFSILSSARKGGYANLINTPRIYSNITVTPLNGNASFDTIEYSGNVINGSLNWSTALQLLASKGYTYSCVPRPPLGFCSWGATIISGSWSGQSDKYLPLRIVVGTNTYYGWARLDVAYGGTSFTIKDYAYNSTPNQSILAGQTK
jgi:hypothetical protein